MFFRCLAMVEKAENYDSVLSALLSQQSNTSLQGPLPIKLSSNVNGVNKDLYFRHIENIKLGGQL